MTAEESLVASEQEQTEGQTEGQTDERRAAALADYIAGDLTMRQIRRKHGVGASTLYEWITTEGLERRPRGRGGSLRTGEGKTAAYTSTLIWEVKYVHTVRLTGKSPDEAMAAVRRKWGEDIDIRLVQCTVPA